MKNKPVVNQEVITLEELRKRFPSKKAFDEWLEENKIYINFDDPKQKVTIWSRDLESFKNAKASLKKNQNNFIKKLEKYKLLGLTKAEKIYSDTIKSIDKTTKRTSLIEQLSTANKEINLYKENCENEYLKLGISAYEIIDPEDFWNSINKVNELVDDIKIKIEKLEHYEHEDIDTTLESSLKEVIHGISTPVDSFELDPEKQPTIDIHALSKYLGKNWSVSTIQKGKYKEIPDDCWVDKNPNRKKRDFTFIAEKIIAWNKACRPKPNQAQTEISVPVVKSKKSRKDYPLIFTIPLDRFIKSFVDKNYLDEENAKLFADRFQSCNLTDDVKKIEWEKDMKSLMTFILASDELGMIKMDDDDRRNGSVPLEPFFGNFLIKIGGTSPTTISNKRENVENVIETIKKQIKIKSGNDKLTFFNVLDKYFTKQYDISLAKNVKRDIDSTVLEILYNSLKQIKTSSKNET